MSELAGRAVIREGACARHVGATRAGQVGCYPGRVVLVDYEARPPRDQSRFSASCQTSRSRWTQVGPLRKQGTGVPQIAKCIGQACCWTPLPLGSQAPRPRRHVLSRSVVERQHLRYLFDDFGFEGIRIKVRSDAVAAFANTTKSGTTPTQGGRLILVAVRVEGLAITLASSAEKASQRNVETSSPRQRTRAFSVVKSSRRVSALCVLCLPVGSATCALGGGVRGDDSAWPRS